MSKTYQSKHGRWKRLQGTLPAGLHEHISHPNIEAATTTFVEQLEEAIHYRLKQRLPRTVKQLRIGSSSKTSRLDMTKKEACPRQASWKKGMNCGR